jgi:hypothetical protein
MLRPLPSQEEPVRVVQMRLTGSAKLSKSRTMLGLGVNLRLDLPQKARPQALYTSRIIG